MGLTQLELAHRIDCSERLIRKMEKGGVVDAKSLSLVQSFFEIRGIEFELSDLYASVHTPAMNFATQWFEARFLHRDASADAKWLAQAVISDPQQAAILDRLGQMSIEGVLRIATADNFTAIRFGLVAGSVSRIASTTLWLETDQQLIVGLEI